MYKDELILYSAPSGVLPIMHFLRDHSSCQYKAVMDITAVDFPTRSQRFEVRLAPHPMVFLGLFHSPLSF